MLTAAAAIAEAPPNTPAMIDVADTFPTLPLENDKDLLALETEVTMSSRRKRELVSLQHLCVGLDIVSMYNIFCCLND